ncbi:hypothetical protein Ctaglu_42140 [Clostridium tagluense]|uniref:Uncharacterized protein n=1 Tax=Clostridium tagluense TaxID=360422 RepID=A0A401USW1_9CLOT|nr:hypothetical protein Ctaglu_42140 [Clostridium tagluense]
MYIIKGCWSVKVCCASFYHFYVIMDSDYCLRVMIFENDNIRIRDKKVLDNFVFNMILHKELI